MSKPFIAVCTLLLLPAGLLAQVGHAPERTPYRDLEGRTNLVPQGGLLGGNGGRLGLGPSNGPLYGLRLETVLSGPTDGFVELMLGQPERTIVDPTAPAATRFSGPERSSLVMVDAGLSILLAGEKTWRGFAPLVGASLGLAFHRTPAADSVSGFRFNAKLATGPHLGFRYYPTRTISLRVEGRLLFWQLKYPTVYFQAPSQAPLDDPVLDLASDPDSEWTSQPVLNLGLGISFRL